MNESYCNWSSRFYRFPFKLKVLSLGFTVKGYDNLSSFYDINLKKERLKILEKKG